MFRRSKTKTVSQKIDKEKIKEYALLGRQLDDLYNSIQPRRGQLYRVAFFKGILTGVGGVLGATVVIALLLWVLSLFDNVPLIGGFVDAIHDTIEK